jgi:FkbM family methyltransferase
MRYHGFELVYSRRTSIVERLLATGTYEPEVTSAIVGALRGSEDPVFLDVGANIGLVSLMVLNCLPDARVYAFEPGRHQRELFAETIRRNRLAGRVVLSPLALSDSAGAATFAVHRTRHAAGDGFLDTGRGGPARFEAVEADTLDSWWRRNSAPRIDVLKLDTEGSELLVLRGARETIARCRPTLVVEVHPQNLSSYPYGPEDVFRHIEGLGYALEELTSTEFVARPV